MLTLSWTHFSFCSDDNAVDDAGMREQNDDEMATVGTPRTIAMAVAAAAAAAAAVGVKEEDCVPNADSFVHSFGDFPPNAGGDEQWFDDSVMRGVIAIPSGAAEGEDVQGTRESGGGHEELDNSFGFSLGDDSLVQHMQSPPAESSPFYNPDSAAIAEASGSAVPVPSNCGNTSTSTSTARPLSCPPRSVDDIDAVFQRHSFLRDVDGEEGGVPQRAGSDYGAFESHEYSRFVNSHVSFSSCVFVMFFFFG